MKDDSMMLKDAKAQEIQRPSVPPRTGKSSSKEPPKPAARPVPGMDKVFLTIHFTERGAAYLIIVEIPHFLQKYCTLKNHRNFVTRQMARFSYFGKCITDQIFFARHS